MRMAHIVLNSKYISIASMRFIYGVVTETISVYGYIYMSTGMLQNNGTMGALSNPGQATGAENYDDY